MTTTLHDQESIRSSYLAVRYQIKMLADHAFILLNLMGNLKTDLWNGGATKGRVWPDYVYLSLENGCRELILLHLRTLNEFFRKGPGDGRRPKDIFANDYGDFSPDDIIEKETEDLISRTLNHLTSESDLRAWDESHGLTKKMLEHCRKFLVHIKGKLDEGSLKGWDSRELEETEWLIKFVDFVLDGSPTGQIEI